MLIKNYGLFWNRKDVYWGAPGRSGSLLGKWSAGKQWVINFRNQAGIYCLYDDSFRMVYAGQAGSGNARLFDRLKQHQNDHLSARWSRFSWFGTLAVIGDERDGSLDERSDKGSVTFKEVLNHFEAVLIHAAEPPLNRQGGRFGFDVEQYLQHRDLDEMYPSQEEMVQYLWDQAE